jgi:cathepsin B
MKGVAAVLLLASSAVASFDSIIRDVNARQTSWRAGETKLTRMTAEERKAMLGVDFDKLRAFTWHQKVYPASELRDIPDTFDSATNWPKCTTMTQIRNQKHCGSCWAFGAAEAMSDRHCVAFGINVPLSAEDINSCSKNLFMRCGSCNGGQPGCAWEYAKSTGVVSDECAPYTAGNDPTSLDTPVCPNKCNGNPSLDWKTDKYLNKDHYTLRGEQQIQKEVMENGPVEVAFHVYEDFMSYTGGIYHHVSGSLEGGHAVKLVGWGVENGEKFWKIANSWDEDWGEKGYFRIRRGTDECSIESQVWAGLPAAH